MNIIFSFLVLYVAGAVFIGIPMAKKSINVWDKAVHTGSKHGFWEHLLFPACACFDHVGNRKEAPPSISMYLEDSENGYGTCVAFNMLFWPIKILYTLLVNVFTLLLLFLVFIILGVPELLGKLLTKFIKKPV